MALKVAGAIAALLLVAMLWTSHALAQGTHPAPTYPLTGNEEVPCQQGGAIKGCTPSIIGQANSGDLRAYGAACDGATEDTAKLQSALNGGASSLVPARTCYTASGLVQQANTALIGANFQPNDLATNESVIACPTSTTKDGKPRGAPRAGPVTCLAINATTNAVVSNYLNGVSILGNPNIPTNDGSIGVKILNGYNNNIQNLNVEGFDTCIYDDTVNGNGLHHYYANIYTRSCKTSHFVIDRVAEVTLLHARFGGINAPNADGQDLITLTRTVAGSNSPNTIAMEDIQGNPAAGPGGGTAGFQAYLTCGICIRNFNSTQAQNWQTNLIEVRLSFSHFETSHWNANPGWIYSDCTLTSIDTMVLDGNDWSQGAGNVVPMFNLCQATRLARVKLVNNVQAGGNGSDTTLTLDTQTLADIALTSNTFSGGGLIASEYAAITYSGISDNHDTNGTSTITVTSSTFAGPRMYGNMGPPIAGQIIIADKNHCKIPGCVLSTACGGVPCTGVAGGITANCIDVAPGACVPGTPGTYAITGSGLPTAGGTLTENTGNYVSLAGNHWGGAFTLKGYFDGCITIIGDTVAGSTVDTASGCIRWNSPIQSWTPTLTCSTGPTDCGTYTSRLGWWWRTANGDWWAAIKINVATITGAGNVSVTGLPPNLGCVTQLQIDPLQMHSGAFGAGVALNSDIVLQLQTSGVINLTTDSQVSGSVTNNSTAVTAAKLGGTFVLAGLVHCMSPS